MKKNVFFLTLLILLSFISNAQLRVQPNGSDASYIFVNDTYIYVEEDVDLESNPNTLEESSIILRNEAQLLQGNGSDQLNKGTGDISVFQEGTVNAWDYNAWASPVGLSFNGSGASAADGNSVFAFRPIGAGGFMDTNQVLFYPTNLTDSQPAIIAGGFNGTTGTAQPLSIAAYWLWTFQSGTNYADWIHISNSGTLPAGQGFTMKGINGEDLKDGGDGRPNNNSNLTDGVGQRYDFRGRPNNGTIAVSVGAGQFSLVGNPYPSALDLDYFLLQNSGAGSFTATDINGNAINVTRSNITTGIAQFWDSNPNVMSHFVEDYQAGYGTYSPLMTLGDGMYVNALFYMYDENGAQIPGSVGNGIAYDRRFSPIGQGFFIEGDAGGMAQFTNNQRIFVQEGSNSDFRNNSSTENQIVEAIGVTTYYPDINNMDDGMPRIKIGIGINDTYSRELGIVLHKYGNSTYDVAGDAKTDILGTDVSFSIEQEKGYVINVAPQEEFQLLPITIDAAAASEFKFRVHFIENFEYSGVFLYDKLTNTHYDILDESTFISLEMGEYKDRFAIKFTRDNQTTSNEASEEQTDTTSEKEDEDSTISDNNEEVSVEEQDPFNGDSILESFSIFQNNTQQQLEITNPQSIDLSVVSLFDMAGKLVFVEQELSTQNVYTFPTGNLSNGIYIVQMTTQSGLTKGRKISVSN